jgi:uncharacterized protein YacL (UPF0231 family)
MNNITTSSSFIDFFTSDEFNYFKFLADELTKSERNYYKFYNTREIKLIMLLNNDILEAHESTLEHYKQLVEDFNLFDLENLSKDDMESFAKKLDLLLRYREYLVSRLDELTKN